jgi:hypothetical protein
MQPAAYPPSDAPILPDTDRIVGGSKLLGAMPDLIRNKHYSIRTEQRLGIRVDYRESKLRDRVKAAGGIWRPRHKLWELPYAEVIALGLESRMVGVEPREA